MNRLFNVTRNTSYMNANYGLEFTDRPQDGLLELPSGNFPTGVTFGTGIIIVNILTLAAIVHYDYIKENYITLIKSLCVADALTGLSLILTVVNVDGPSSGIRCFSHFGVYVYRFASHFAYLVSHWHTVALSVDRLLAVKLALRYHAIMTPKKLAILTLAVWGIGIIEEIVFLILKWDKSCNSGSNLYLHAHDVIPQMHFLLIFLINASIYSYLWRIARRHRNMIAHNGAQQQAPMIDKATVTVIVINVLFAIMWGPYVVVKFVQGFSSHFLTKKHLVPASTALQIVGYVNTILNNVVYFLMNKGIRRRIMKQFRCSNCDISTK